MRSPVTMPPVRSPFVKAARMPSAASAQARFGRRAADVSPVTTCTLRWPGETAISTAPSASVASFSNRLSAVARDGSASSPT